MRTMWIIAMLFLFLSEALVVLRLINRNGRIPAVFVILVLLLPTLVGRMKERRVKGGLAENDAANANRLSQRLATTVLAAYLAMFFGLLVLVIMSGSDVMSDHLFNMIAAILATIICIVSLVLMPAVRE
jgi:hypothetical protein